MSPHETGTRLLRMAAKGRSHKVILTAGCPTRSALFSFKRGLVVPGTEPIATQRLLPKSYPNRHRLRPRVSGQPAVSLTLRLHPRHGIARPRPELGRIWKASRPLIEAPDDVSGRGRMSSRSEG